MGRRIGRSEKTAGQGALVRWACGVIRLKTRRDGWEEADGRNGRKVGRRVKQRRNTVEDGRDCRERQGG